MLKIIIIFITFNILFMSKLFAVVETLALYTVQINCVFDENGKLTCDFNSPDISWANESTGSISIHPEIFKSFTFTRNITSRPNILLNIDCLDSVLTLRGKNYGTVMSIPFSFDRAYVTFDTGLTSRRKYTATNASYSVSGQTLTVLPPGLISSYIEMSTPTFNIMSAGYDVSFNKDGGGLSGILSKRFYRADIYSGSVTMNFIYEYGDPWGMSIIPTVLNLNFTFVPNISTIDIPSTVTMDVSKNSSGYNGFAKIDSRINGNFSTVSGITIKATSQNGGVLKNGENKIPYKVSVVSSIDGRIMPLIDGEGGISSSVITYNNITENYASSVPLSYSFSFSTPNTSLVSGDYSDTVTILYSSNAL